MALLNDIKRMQSEGRTEQEIISGLKEQGVSPREITDALSQSKIKEAVSAEGVDAGAPLPQGEQMAPSIGAVQEQYSASPAQEATEEYAPPQYQESPQQYAPSQQEAAPQYPEYQQYQQPQGEQYPQQQYQQPQMGNISPDTITEISEQVVTEKLAPLRKDLEKVADMKTMVESKMESLDERLKRIEKIIDRLQLSIMQKVGEYITNIDDIKKEIVETQKSFKAMTPNSSVSREERAEKPKKQKEFQEE